MSLPPFTLDRDRDLVLCIDVQERFLPAIPAIAPGEPVGRRLGQLLAGAALLGVRRVLSEQVPAKLGATLPHLRAAAAQAPVLAKQAFSACAEPALAAELDRDPGAAIVLAGIEAHICVLATAADLRARGRRVLVAGDAIAARDPAHAVQAATALRDLGCLVVPVESLLFRWQGVASGDTFRALSALVR